MTAIKATTKRIDLCDAICRHIGIRVREKPGSPDFTRHELMTLLTYFNLVDSEIRELRIKVKELEDAAAAKSVRK